MTDADEAIPNQTPQPKELCSTCIQTSKAISSQIHSWRQMSGVRSIRPNIKVNWEPEKYTDNTMALNIIEHLPRAHLILDSAKSCQLCALIRDALVVGHYFNEHRDELTGGILVEKLPPDLVPAQARSLELFRSPEFCNSTVYLRLSVYYEVLNHTVTVLDQIDVLVTEEYEPGPGLTITGHLAVQAQDGTAAQKSGFITTRPLPYTENIQNVAVLLEQWLLKCKSNHSECYKTIEGTSIDESVHFPLFPTRVVELCDERTVRVLQTNGTRGKWIALSHCWGDSEHQPPKLTTDTLDKWATGVPLDVLPQTFRDAVRLAWALSVRYVWIDSLCILQDDKEDWLREAPKMGNIYEKAILTLAATGAADSSVGLFKPDRYSQDQLRHVEIPFYELNQQHDESGGMKQDGSFSLGIEWRHDEWDTFSSLDGAALSQRGWITQEWMLSRRTVHFLGGRILWACRVECLCESGKELRLGYYHHYELDAERFNWADLVIGHSSRKFTNGEDKLVALEGLVNEMRKAREDEYHYGIWTGALEEELLWLPVLGSKDPFHSHVPSWSWASREGAIKYGAGYNRLRFSPEEFRKCFKGIDEYGVMRIRSRLRPTGRTQLLTAVEGGRYFSGEFGVCDRGSRHGVHILVDEAGKEFGWAFLDDGNFADSDFQDVCLLLLGPDDQYPEARDRSWGNTRQLMSQFCMLVEPSSESGSFKRVGVAKVKNASLFDAEEERDVLIR